MLAPRPSAFANIVAAVKLAALGALAFALVATTPAKAERTLKWKDEWPRFRTSEWIVTGVAGATVLTLYLVPRFTPTWGHPILFDAPVRDALRTDHGPARDAWQQWGTYAYYAMAAYPILIDGLLVPLARGSSTVAAQTTLINLQAFAISGFVFRVTEATVRRARPSVWACKEEKGSYEDCRGSGSLGDTNSFIGGHVTIAATGAALMCTHHAHLRLYGGAWDAIACGVGVAMTGFVAIGRMVTDNHYATDNLAGVAVGTLSGWLMPTLLHYGFDGKGPGAGAAALKYLPLPTASATSMGLTWAAVL